MINHDVRVYRSEENLARKDQLAWKIAEVAADPVAVEPEVTEMVINRVIDNAAVAAASLNRAPGRRGAGAGRCAPPSTGGDGATVFGIDRSRSRPSGRPGPTASRCASSTTTTPSSPPSTRTPATTSRRSSPSPSTRAATGADLVRGIATGYEIQVDLVKAISLHEHKIDHVAHLGPSRRRRHRHPARPADRDDLPGHRPGAAHHHGHAAVAQGRDLHAGRRTRRPSPARWPSRPSTGRCAARPAPTPIYEGEDGVIAWLLDGPDAALRVPLPRRARPSAPSSTPTPRSTRPSTRRRPGSTWPASCTASIRRPPTRRTSSDRASTPATTPTT